MLVVGPFMCWCFVLRFLCAGILLLCGAYAIIVYESVWHCCVSQKYYIVVWARVFVLPFALLWYIMIVCGPFTWFYMFVVGNARVCLPFYEMLYTCVWPLVYVTVMLFSCDFVLYGCVLPFLWVYMIVAVTVYCCWCNCPRCHMIVCGPCVCVARCCVFLYECVVALFIFKKFCIIAVGPVHCVWPLCLALVCVLPFSELLYECC